MRKGWLVLLILCFLTSLGLAAEKYAKIEVAPGYTFAGTNDEQNKVSEFTSTRSQATPEVKGEVKLGAFEANGYFYYRDKDEKEWNVEADFGRIFRVDYGYNGFIHRLQHDRLYADEPRFPKNIPPNNVNNGLVAFNPFWITDPDLHLAGAQMVAADDLDAGRDYQIVRREQEISGKFQLPMFPYVILRAKAKEEREFGWRQHTLMTGKCTPCHIVGTGRRINQYTRDFTVGATIKYGIVTVDYSHLWRHFDNQAGNPTIQFDYVMAPEEETYIFNPRLLYDSQYDYETFFSGGGFIPTNIERRPYAEIPDIDKQTDKLKVRVDLPYRTTLYSSFVYSSVENSYTDKDYDTTVYALRITTRPTRNLTLSLRGKYYTIDNDDVTVRLEKYSNDESLDPIYQSWGATDASSFDYVRKSNMDRDVWEGGIDIKYVLSKYYFRAGYTYTYIDRDHDTWKEYLHKDEVNLLQDESFLLDDTTKIHKVKLTFGGHPLTNLNFRLTYKYEHQQDEFANANGIGFKDNFNLYGLPGGVPYYAIFRNRNRKYDASNVPTDVHDVKLVADWTPINQITASVNLGYKYQKNDDSDWEADTYVAGLNLLILPMEKLTVNLGANYEYSTYETRMCVDLFGG